MCRPQPIDSHCNLSLSQLRHSVLMKMASINPKYVDPSHRGQISPQKSLEIGLKTFSQEVILPVGKYWHMGHSQRAGRLFQSLTVRGRKA